MPLKVSERLTDLKRCNAKESSGTRSWFLVGLPWQLTDSLYAQRGNLTHSCLTCAMRLNHYCAELIAMSEVSEHCLLLRRADSAVLLTLTEVIGEQDAAVVSAIATATSQSTLQRSYQ
jgi:hypothetical protein